MCLARFAARGEFDAADVANGDAVGSESSGAGADGVDDVAVVEVVIGIDFDFLFFLLFLADCLEGSDGTEDFGVEACEGLFSGPEAGAVEGESLKGAGGIGLHANFEGRKFGIGHGGCAGCPEWHADVEVPFWFEDLQGAHEEDHELKHDIDHGCHVDCDFAAGAAISEFHGIVADRMGFRGQQPEWL